MSDYISREAALAQCKRHDDYTGWIIADGIEAIPAADVEPVRHGKWNIRRPHRSALCLVCSACGRKVDNDAIGILLERGENGVAHHLYPYCHCGAKMDLEGENDS